MRTTGGFQPSSNERTRVTHSLPKRRTSVGRLAPLAMYGQYRWNDCRFLQVQTNRLQGPFGPERRRPRANPVYGQVAI